MPDLFRVLEQIRRGAAALDLAKTYIAAAEHELSSAPPPALPPAPPPPRDGGPFWQGWTHRGGCWSRTDGAGILPARAQAVRPARSSGAAHANFVLPATWLGEGPGRHLMGLASHQMFAADRAEADANHVRVDLSRPSRYGIDVVPIVRAGGAAWDTRVPMRQTTPVAWDNATVELEAQVLGSVIQGIVRINGFSWGFNIHTPILPRHPLDRVFRYMYLGNMDAEGDAVVTRAY